MGAEPGRWGILGQGNCNNYTLGEGRMAVNKAQLAQHMLRSMKAAGSTVWDGEKAVVVERGEEEASAAQPPEGGESEPKPTRASKRGSK